MPGRWLLVLLYGWLAVDQLLLWRFLGLTQPLLYAAGAALALLLGRWMVRAGSAIPPVPLGRLALLLLFALTLYALGGEGRLFYANIDWQVRDAVLRDMTIHPWPFVYSHRDGEAELLRAPIGFFLGPALVAKGWGLQAGDFALLLQNSVMLTAVLGLGSTLFDSTRRRIVALVTVLAFSGADLLLQLLIKGRPEDHIEFTFDWLQYSAHITQAFWVPQHALAGWIGALLLLLWRRGSIPLWPMLAILPLTAIWSPLPLIGMMPFVAFAAAASLRSGALGKSDVLLPALAVCLAAPALVYLGAAPDAVGARLVVQPWEPLTLFLLAEVAIWALPLMLWVRSPLTGLVSMATILLLALPFAAIGWSIDLMMRASIPALAIIAVATADALGRRDTPLRARLWLGVALTLGSATGFHEVARALSEPASPRGRCSFYGAWDTSFSAYPKGSHLAPLDEVAEVIRPAAPTTVLVNDPVPCWDGDWLRPSGV